LSDDETSATSQERPCFAVRRRAICYQIAVTAGVLIVVF